MKIALIGAMAFAVQPFSAHAQSSLFTPGTSFPGFYVGAEGGVNWLLNNGAYNMNTGWAAGGVLGYDFVGPRVELEGVYRSNNGTRPGVVGVTSSSVTCPPNVQGVPVCAQIPGTTVFGNVGGHINQLAFLANLLYDFAPGATITPYIGAGAGIAFIDQDINGCSLCSTQFAYQGILGLGLNIDQNVRVNLDGRYYGTTSPGTYLNNNLTLMLSISYKFGQPAAAAAPPPPPVASPSFMVFFDWDRSNLSAQALQTIKQAAEAFKTKGNARITATGHTDTSGPENYNMALSLRRANAVKDALVREGVPATAIEVIGRGEQGLLVPTPDGVREPQNRRVEIVIQ
jgi:OOP family OmpA-OmpF porin